MAQSTLVTVSTFTNGSSSPFFDLNVDPDLVHAASSIFSPTRPSDPTKRKRSAGGGGHGDHDVARETARGGHDLYLEESEDDDDDLEDARDHPDDAFVVERDEDEVEAEAISAALVDRSLKRPRHDVEAGLTAPGVRAPRTAEPPKEPKYLCARCDESFVRHDHLCRHLIKLHLTRDEKDELESKIACPICAVRFARLDGLKRHYKDRHPSAAPPVDWTPYDAAWTASVTLAVKRNQRELDNLARGRGLDEVERLPPAIPQWPFDSAPPVKTRWTSYFPRHLARLEGGLGAGDGVASADDNDDEDDTIPLAGDADEDLGRPAGSIRRFEASSVYQPPTQPSMPAPPLGDTDDDYAYEEDDVENGDDRGGAANGPTYVIEDDSGSLETGRSARAMPRRPAGRATASQPPPKRRRHTPGKPAAHAVLPPILHILLVDSRTGTYMRFSTGRDTKMRDVLAIYCQQRGLDRRFLRCYHRGVPLPDQSTPEKLGMQDGEHIYLDVLLPPSGSTRDRPHPP